jgi:hypothetical protein
MLSPLFDDDTNYSMIAIMNEYPNAPYIIIFAGMSIALFSVFYSYTFDIKRKF